MDLIGEIAGFLGAWLDFMGLELMLLVGFLVAVTYWTRRRAGRRYDHRAPDPAAYDDFYGVGGGDL
jgi:hypothetical protein